MNLKRAIAGAAIALGATAVAASANAANLVLNGSFELASAGNNTPTGNGEQLVNGSTAMADWTVVDGPGFDGVAWLPNGNGYGLSTPFGNDFLDLTGYNDQQPYFGVTQTITTTPGKSYTLTFDLGVDQVGGLFTGPVGVTASAGSTSGTFNNYNPAGTGNIWQSFSLNFTASSAATAITIQGLQGDQYIGLDNVAVTGSAVPEPATWAMMLVGFGGLGAAMRSRRKASAATA